MMEERRDEALTFGHHACPRALRELAESAFPDSSRPLRLVIPPVTSEHSADLDALLERIGEREHTVLVLNDWGTLARCAKKKKSGSLAAALCLGALLSAQDTDPVLEMWTRPQPDHLVIEEQGIARLRWAPPPETLREHWRCPSAKHWAPLLDSLGVKEIELCRQAIGPPPALPGFRVTVLPFAILSVLPCRGDCAHCGGKEMTRCGVKLQWDRSMPIVPGGEA